MNEIIREFFPTLNKNLKSQDFVLENWKDRVLKTVESDNNGKTNDEVIALFYHIIILPFLISENEHIPKASLIVDTALLEKHIQYFYSFFNE